MVFKAAFYFATLMVLISGCADRDRSNPLDPQNPRSGGKPTGVVARAIQDTVFVSWEDVGLKDVLFYHVYRSVGAGEPQLVWSAPYPTTAFTDTSVVYGVSYGYQISASGANFESPRSDMSIAEPGPNIIWVSGSLSGVIAKLTHDGRYALDLFTNFGDVRGMAADGRRNVIWVIQNGFGNERAFRLTEDGEVLLPLVNLTDPLDIELVDRTGSVWVADGNGEQILRFASNGVNEYRIPNFNDPIALSVDQSNESCWVADNGFRTNGSRVIVRLTAGGDIGSVIELSGGDLFDVEVDDRDGTVWVAQRNAVLKLERSSSGYEVTNRLGDFGLAARVEIDQGADRLWVLDYDASRLRQYSLEGELMFEIDDLNSPRTIAIDEFDNTCYVADTGNDRVVRVSETGRILSTFSNIRSPIALSIEN